MNDGNKKPTIYITFWVYRKCDDDVNIIQKLDDSVFFFVEVFIYFNFYICLNNLKILGLPNTNVSQDKIYLKRDYFVVFIFVIRTNIIKKFTLGGNTE